MEKILVIEDEALVARELKGRLTKMGWEVVGVAYGAEGIELARETKPDLLLSDIHLKDGVDGIEVAREIQQERDIPVVFLTAYSDEDTVSRAMAASTFGYIIKPVENRDLQITIEMALYKFKVEKELRETQQLLQTALTCIGTALVFVDNDGFVTNLNQDAAALFDERECIGRAWANALHIEGATSIARTIDEALSQRQVTRIAPFVINRPQQHMLLIDGIIGPMDDGAVFILRELAEINNAIEVLPGSHELLSALGPNEFAPSESALCQMLISPDVPTSAKMMEQLARYLNGALRSTDVLSVFGGSLISVSMPYTSISEAEQIADTLMLEMIRFDKKALRCSIGLAHSTAGDQQPLELFRRASEALDRAREAGGDTVVVWDEFRPPRHAGDVPTDREYHQLILLWNVMNVVSRTSDLEDMGRKVCRHMLQTLGLQVVALLTRAQQSVSTIVVESASGKTSSVADLGLSASEFNLVNSFFDSEGADAQYEQTYLFQISRDIVMFIRADMEIAEQEVTFLRTLVGYFASGVARVSGSQMTIAPDVPSDQKTLVYESPQTASLLEAAKLVAPTDATVLLMGESGTGKELLARYIHDISPRKDKPFIIVDCGAVVDNLIESELFGHEKGAFTGADRKFSGRLREAAGGTVLLDEIGELPLNVQVKLLRFVQDREVAAVGSTYYEKVNTRVIAATNRDLKAMVAEGTFRQDLYYRLNVFDIQTLALRERPDDIMVLANHYLSIYAGQYGKAPMAFSTDAAQALLQYDWPGNVRELMNLVNRAVILSKDNRVNTIHLGLFPQATPDLAGFSTDQGLITQVQQLVEFSLQHRPDLPPIGQWLEEDLIRDRIAAHAGVLSQAAQNLGMPETTLRRKVSKMRQVHGEEAPTRPAGWIGGALIGHELERLAQDREIPLLELILHLLVDEFERRNLARQDAARLLGVSLPTYRRYLS